MTKLLLICFSLLWLPVAAQNLSPEETARIDNEIFPAERNKKPGYIVTILRNNRIVYNRATGYINIRKRLPLTIDSRIALASVSKQFTAMGILLLEQEGKLSLTDDIHKYIPELPSYPFPVQLRHLLSHTSGIRDHITILGWENNQQNHFYHFPGMISVLRNYCWTSFPAGEDFAYSNTGYMLLAYVIERVSGQRFEDFMKDRIFEPLDMTSTEFSFRRKGEEFGYSTPYDYNKRRKSFVRHRFREANALGATGIYTTVSDMIKWNKNFTDPLVGDPELIARMEQSDTLNNGMSVHYNNGLKHRNLNGLHIIEHSGGWANYNIQYTRVPELGLCIIVAANNEFDYPIEMAEDVLKVFLPPAGPRKDTPVSFEETGLKEGLYLADNMTLREVKNQGGHFVITIPGYSENRDMMLYRNAADSCLADEEGYPFCPQSDHFIWSGGGYFNTPRTYTLLTPDPDFDGKACEGRYRNCEMGSVRLKYCKLQDRYVLIGSLIKRIRLEKVADRLYEAKRAGFKMQFIDPYTFNIGNSRVFGLEFKRVEE